MEPPVCPMVPEPRRVARVVRETHDTVTLTLDPGAAPFLPGQFNMVYAFAVGEVPLSLSGDPERNETSHTVKAVGAVSEALCRVGQGSVVGVRGPYGAPWPLAELAGKDVLLVAGGLGLAPLRPLVYQLLKRRADYRRVWLLIGARTPADLLYRRELESWRPALDVRAIVDRAEPGWSGRAGVVPALLGELALDPAATVALVCGPEVMMRFTARELAQRGVSDERIYLSLERNMKCAVGFCGHCQYGPSFVCKDGPVFRLDRIRSRLWLREL